MGPTAGPSTGWVAGEADGVMDDIRWVRTRYTIDPKRIIAHGQGVGGQMAFYLAINQREVIRGAVPVGAVLASNPKDASGEPPHRVSRDRRRKRSACQTDRGGAEEARRAKIQGPLPRNEALGQGIRVSRTWTYSARWSAGWTRWISSRRLPCALLSLDRCETSAPDPSLTILPLHWARLRRAVPRKRSLAPWRVGKTRLQP